jgi:hypothetical protein
MVDDSIPPSLLLRELTVVSKRMTHTGSKRATDNRLPPLLVVQMLISRAKDSQG